MLNSRKLLDITEKFLPILGFILLFYLLYTIDLSRVEYTISRMNPLFFLLSGALLLLKIPLSVYKWYMLAKSQGIEVRYPKMFRFYMMAHFYSVITPGGLGSYIRVKYLYDEGKELGGSVSNVVIDGMVEMVNLSVLAIFSTVLLFSVRLELLIPILFLLATSALPLLLLMRKKLGSRFAKKILLMVVPSKYRGLFERGTESLFSKPPSLKIFLASVVLSLFTWLICFTQIYLLMLAFGENISLFGTISVWSIAVSISFLPITIGGLGVREWLMVVLSRRYGIAATASLSISLMGYVIVYLIPALVGAVFIILHATSYIERHEKKVG
ncbi:MAG: flippase-like domain-containing protein [Thermoplasmata archaeon]|nr:flippase-like domain-containing protein [Thermoplasmata archaeon]